MGNFKRVISNMDRREVPLYKRLADGFGFLAIYPFFSIISVLLGEVFLMLASEVFLALIFFFLAYTFNKLSRFRSVNRLRVLFFIEVISGVVLLLPYLFWSLVYIDPFIGLSGKLIGFVSAGLFIHSISNVIGLGSKLDRFGGLATFGAIILIIRVPIFVLGGLILLALGFGGASSEFRKVYYIAKHFKKV